MNSELLCYESDWLIINASNYLFYALLKFNRKVSAYKKLPIAIGIDAI